MIALYVLTFYFLTTSAEANALPPRKSVLVHSLSAGGGRNIHVLELLHTKDLPRSGDSDTHSTEASTTNTLSAVSLPRFPVKELVTPLGKHEDKNEDPSGKFSLAVTSRVRFDKDEAHETETLPPFSSPLEGDEHYRYHHHHRNPHYDSGSVQAANRRGEGSRARRMKEVTLTPDIIGDKIHNHGAHNDSPPFEIDFPPEPRVPMNMSAAFVIGFRIETIDNGASYELNGVSTILADSLMPIRLFGQHFTNQTIVKFVQDVKTRGATCEDTDDTPTYPVTHIGPHGASAIVDVVLHIEQSEEFFFICIRENNTETPWVHQGSDPWITIKVYGRLLPLWLDIVFILLLLMLSGLFAGLTLGLLALDRTDLRILANTGSEKERMYAKTILPLRSQGNYLLCSLVLGNVLINSTLTILLDDLTSGILAVTIATVSIVIFGEIIPQAFCSRHGLAVGAKTILITRLIMIITFPLSYLISVILDKALGEEIGNVYNRERLKELIRVTQGTNDLEKDEVNIIAGALELKQKTAVDVMTRLEDVFMLPIDTVLDFDTVSEIMSNGYSRIPVYESTRVNVISLLHAKDLAFVDPDDKMPLRTICEFYNNTCYFVFENVTLDVLFKVFKQGNKGHMAFVQRVKVNDKSDPIYEVCGLVTMEDVIEELIQEEINDETDVWLKGDHRRGSKAHQHAISDVERVGWNWKPEGGTTVSPQLTLAAFQYLSTAVDEFNDSRISKGVLERLLKQNIYFHIKIKNKDTMKTDPNTILYETGKPADYFTMILEGKAHAEIGKERLIFESGPFSYFGTNCLSVEDTSAAPGKIWKSSQSTQPELSVQSPFVPDYTVRAVTDITYFQISRSMYLAARQATLLEKSNIHLDLSMNANESKTDEQLHQQLDEVQVITRSDSVATDVSKSLTLPAPIRCKSPPMRGVQFDATESKSLP